MDRGQDRPSQTLTCDDIFNGPIAVTLIDKWLLLLLPLQLRDEVHLLPPGLGWRLLGDRGRNGKYIAPAPGSPLPRPRNARTRVFLVLPQHQQPARAEGTHSHPPQATGAPCSPRAGSVPRNESIEEGQISGVRIAASKCQAQAQPPTLDAGTSPLPGASAPTSWAAASFFHCSTSCSAF